MRLFIALLFKKEKREILHDMLMEVKAICSSGQFTTKDNLHLTLVYIGEADEALLAGIKRKLGEIRLDAFRYTTNRIKYFKKSSEQLIVYLGIDKSHDLERLFHHTRRKLKEAGCHCPSQNYTPHITFGRKVKVSKNGSLHNIYTNPLTLEAERISIMESKRVDQKLVYEELYSIPLQKKTQV